MQKEHAERSYPIKGYRLDRVYSLHSSRKFLINWAEHVALYRQAYSNLGSSFGFCRNVTVNPQKEH